MKRINPYTRLKEEAIKYVNSVRYARHKSVFYFEAKTLNKRDIMLKERVKAAEQLGYDVVVTIDKEDNIHFTYVSKPIPVPYELS